MLFLALAVDVVFVIASLSTAISGHHRPPSPEAPPAPETTALPPPEPLADVPGPVRDLTAQTEDGNGSVLLTWRPPTDRGRPALLGYLVTATPTLGTFAVRGLSAVLRGLLPGVRYAFQVTAYNDLATGVDASSAAVVLEPPPPEPAPVRSTPQNWLWSEDGLISTAVGAYYSLAEPVPHWEAVLDYRMWMVPYYFDGHNPGVFTPLLSEHVGSVIDYWDGRGRLHRFRIVAIRSWAISGGEPPPVSSSVAAQFQTCRTSDGSVDWVYDAVAA